MMVCYNYINTLFVTVVHLFMGGNTVVHTYNQSGSHLNNCLKGWDIHTVALLQTVGYPVKGFDSNALKIAHQNRYCSGAVCVIIAVDTDLFPLLPGLQQSVDSFLHVRQSKGVIKIREVRLQIGHGLISSVIATLDQQSGRQRRQATFLCQFLHCRNVGFCFAFSFFPNCVYHMFPLYKETGCSTVQPAPGFLLLYLRLFISTLIGI